MKVVVSVRSDVAYQLITKLIQRDPRLPNIEFKESNVKTIRDLEDAIEFFRADVYIVDSHLEDSEMFIQMLEQQNQVPIVIKDDVKDALVMFVERHGQAEVSEPTEQKDVVAPRVVIQEKIIEKEIIRTAYQAIPSSIVIVGSLYRGAGSTLLATNLSRMVAKRGVDVAYVEHPMIRPYMFDYLQIHNEEHKTPYIDLASEIQKEGIARGKNRTFTREGINWHVNDSRIPQVPSFTYENMLSLSHAIHSSVLIVDISDRWLDPEIQKYLYSANAILLCVEPDPIKYEWSLYSDGSYMQREKKIMDFLLNEPDIPPTEVVLMKNIKGIDIKGLKSIMHKKPLVSLPYIEYSTVQQALFDNKLIYDFKGNDQVFEESLLPVLAKFLPKDFVPLKNKSNGILQRFKKK